MIKILLAPFKFLYKILDVILITPISKLVYWIRGLFKGNSSKLETWLNRPNVLIYLSLLCAIVAFLLVDSNVINLTEREAEVLSGQKVNVIYNQEAYIVEGVPDTVDITLIGSKSSIYLATQLDNNDVTLDLSGYGPGTYKVDLKYNHSIDSVSYKLDPSKVTVKISEKVSEVFSLSYDLMNVDKLSNTLSISNVKLDTSEVICKSSQENLDKVASVKALVDASKITLTESGTQTLEDVTLVAYDANGNKLDNIEIVPTSVKADVTIDSYHRTLPVKVNTTGTMASGKAIASLTSSVSTVDVYGDKATVDALDSIEALVDVTNLSSDKSFSVELTKPSGVRYLSSSKTNVNVTVGTESQKTISGVVVQATGLGSNLSVSAASDQDKVVDVIVKGVDSVIENITADQINAYVDLSGLKAGSQTVPVTVTIDDVRVTVQAAKTEITVNIK